jgi:hypothetical protein
VFNCTRSLQLPGLSMIVAIRVMILALLALLQLILAEVSVLKAVQLVYDTSPKLRIRGSGFDAQGHDIHPEIGAVGQPSLVINKDYMVTKDADGDGIILKLLGNRR